MFRSLFTLFFFLLFIDSYSQYWEKAKVFHYAFENSNYRHVSDKNGNVYIVGELNADKLVLDSITLETNGKLDCFIVKLDSNFKVRWAKSFGGIEEDMITGIVIDNSGDVVICGYFSKTLLIQSDSLISRGMSDFFIAKLEPSGKLIWAKSGGSNYQDYSFSRTGGIEVDYNNSIIVTGLFAYENHSGIPNKRTAWFDTFSITSYGGQDAFLAKYSTNGKVIWVKNFGSYSDDYGEAYFNNNFIYLTGRGEERFKYETGEIFNPDLSSIGFIIKLDTNGKVIWAKASFLTNTGTHGTSSLCSDSRDNLYVIGYYSSSYNTKLNFDNYNIELPQSALCFYIAKLNSKGKILWFKNGRGNFNKIIRKDDNHFIVAGSMRGNASYEAKYLSAAGFNNSLILEIDSNGKPLVFQNFGNTGDNICDNISLTADNKILVTGNNWTGSLVFDSITLTKTDKPAGFYIARRNFVPKPVGISTVPVNKSFKIFPNPNNGSFTIEIDNPEMDAAIEVFDLLGKLVRKVERVEKVTLVNLDVESGIYLVKVKNGEVVWNQKMVLTN